MRRCEATARGSEGVCVCACMCGRRNVRAAQGRRRYNGRARTAERAAAQRAVAEREQQQQQRRGGRETRSRRPGAAGPRRGRTGKKEKKKKRKSTTTGAGWRLTERPGRACQATAPEQVVSASARLSPPLRVTAPGSGATWLRHRGEPGGASTEPQGARCTAPWPMDRPPPPFPLPTDTSTNAREKRQGRACVRASVSGGCVGRPARRGRVQVAERRPRLRLRRRCSARTYLLARQGSSGMPPPSGVGALERPLCARSVSIRRERRTTRGKL